MDMSQSAITPEVASLLAGKNFASFATLMKDGSPQVTPVWIDYDGRYIIVNTAEGRSKTNNTKSDGRVALCVMDSSNPYHMVAIRGRVEKITNEGADLHIDKMAKKYLGLDKYPLKRPSEKRTMLQIRPESVHHQKPPA